jgi:hypothetical protein
MGMKYRKIHAAQGRYELPQRLHHVRFCDSRQGIGHHTEIVRPFNETLESRFVVVDEHWPPPLLAVVL